MYPTFQDFKLWFSERLKNLFSETETSFLFNILLEEVCGVTKINYLMDPTVLITGEQMVLLDRVVTRLLQNEPWQYIFNKAYFLGNEYSVNSGVLIPRPETEELVQWIFDDYRNSSKAGLHVLDIGTGSGIIPISCKQRFPSWNVRGCDVSDRALKVARLNAQNILKEASTVDFYLEDILKPKRFFNPPIDVLVSNPPYVLISDKAKMSENVLAFEPHIALFVPDNDPLLFYRKIIEYANDVLSETGCIYFETHEDSSLKVGLKKLCNALNFNNIEFKTDLQQRQRMAKIWR